MRRSTESRWQNYALRLVLLTAICSCLCGCASWVVRPAKVVLLPEERIFTVPAGQVIKVNLDKKPLEMTFPNDMKLVSPTVLVRQEKKLNDAILKSDTGKKTVIAVVTAILGILGSVFGIAFFKRLPKISAKVETK